MIEKLIGRFCCNARSCIKVKLYLLQFLTKKKKEKNSQKDVVYSGKVRSVQFGARPKI